MSVAGRGDCEKTVAGTDDKSVQQRHVETQRCQCIDDERRVAEMPDAVRRRPRRPPRDGQHRDGGEHQRHADDEERDGGQAAGRRQPGVQDDQRDRRGAGERHVGDAVDRRTKREREVDHGQRQEEDDEQDG